MNPITTATTTRSKGEVQVNSNRRIALVVGVLFILTFVTSIGAAFAYGPVLTNSNYVIGAGADTRVFLGAFLELFLIITNIGCAVVLFPLLKRQSEAIALGYVAARIMECTFILVGILSVLAVVTLRQHAVAANSASLVAVGKSLIAIKNWTFLLGPGFVDGIGTGLMLGWLMYRSGLVSRRVALFGVVGGPLLAASGIAVLFGVIKPQSTLQSVATAPEIVWEAFLGLWLTFKGFRRVAADAGMASVRAVAAIRSMRSLPHRFRCRTRHNAEPGFGRAPTSLYTFSKEILMISLSLVVDNLTKRYGNKTAVDGLTFTVHPGVVTGFLGRNGSGKVHDHAPDSRTARPDKWLCHSERQALRGTSGSATRCRCIARGTRCPSGSFRLRSPPRTSANARNSARARD